MSGKAISGTTVRLPLDVSKELLEQCQKRFLLPRQVIALGMGKTLTEPVILQIPAGFSENYPLSAFSETNNAVRRRNQQESLYLLILSQIIKGIPAENFEKIANSVHGTKRVYFGRTREEVEGTGSSNKAARIHDTEWYASVNNSGEKKQEILTEVMRRLGFSFDYIWMISRVPSYRRLPLQGITFQTN